MTTKRLDKQVRVSHLTLSHVIKLLLDGPATAVEIEEASGLHKVTVYELMRSLRKVGASHISAWDCDTMGRDAIAVFSLGAGVDACRRTLSRAAISARYRDRKKAKLLDVARGHIILK